MKKKRSLSSLDERLNSYKWPTWIREGNYKTVTKDSQLAGVVSDIRRGDVVSVDFETTGLDTHTDDIVGVALTTRPGAGYYVGFGHLGPNVSTPSKRKLLELLAKLRLLWFNGKFDWGMAMFREGIDMPIDEDGLIYAYLHDSNEKDLRLKTLLPNHLNLPSVDLESDVGIDWATENLSQCSAAALTRYACQDTDGNLRIANKLRDHKHVAAQGNIQKLELALMPVVSRMEHDGVLLDVDGLEEHCAATEQIVAEAEQECWQLAGEEFDIGSSKQLAEVLFEKLGLPVKARTAKTQAPSTAEAALMAIQGAHPVIPAVLRWKKKSKLVSSFLRTLPDHVRESTGRIHANFKQHGTASGRFSCTKPNMQQMSKRDEEAKEIVRGCFIAPEGSWLGALDLDQIEYRLFASMGRIRGLCEQIEAGRDVHRATAVMMFEAQYDNVTAKQRQDGKNINFAQIYGQGEQALAATLGVSIERARQLRESYFSQMPEAAAYIRRQHIFVREHGYVKTHFGRRRPLHNLIYSRNRKLVGDALRRAVNTPIQGTAADIIKIGMVRVDGIIAKELGRDKARMVLTVHDELVFEFSNDLTKRDALMPVKRAMEVKVKGFVPILVTAETGANWGKMTEWTPPEEPKSKNAPKRTPRKPKVQKVTGGPALPDGATCPALVIQIATLSDKQAAFLRMLFEKYPGSARPYIVFRSEGKTLELPEDMSCAMTPEVINYVKKCFKGDVIIGVYDPNAQKVETNSRAG